MTFEELEVGDVLEADGEPGYGTVRYADVEGYCGVWWEADEVNFDTPFLADYENDDLDAHLRAGRLLFVGTSEEFL